MRRLLGGLAALVALAVALGPAPSSTSGSVVAAVPVAPAMPSLVIPDLVRVGLATDLESLTLPCCGTDLRAQAGTTQVALVETFTIAPAARGRRGVYRLQVAALKDEGQARDLAIELNQRHGQPTAVVFDAGTDFYRVRFGRYKTRQEAEDASRALAGAGVLGAFVVSEPSPSLAEGLRVTQGKDSWRVRGRWVAVWSRSDAGVRLPSGHYRGRILVYLNDRGTLNLINELPLEDYLRGVVPKEMGPEEYDNLDGLKAQAVAARVLRTGSRCAGRCSVADLPGPSRRYPQPRRPARCRNLLAPQALAVRGDRRAARDRLTLGQHQVVSSAVREL